VATKLGENVVDVGKDALGVDANDDDAQLGEALIAKSIGIAPSLVNAAIDFDDETDGWREEVDDVPTENHLPPKANAERAATKSCPQQCLGRRWLDTHCASARG
jgi:hypothetical protein